MTMKKGRPGGTPKRPANERKITPSSTYPHRKSNTRLRRFQVRSNADAVAAERAYILERDSIPLRKRGKDPETWHDLNRIRDSVNADGEGWP